MWGAQLGVLELTFRCSRRPCTFPCLCENDSSLYYNNVDLSTSCGAMDRDSSARESQAVEACQVVSDRLV
jgi:hypothetical protein